MPNDYLADAIIEAQLLSDFRSSRPMTCELASHTRLSENVEKTHLHLSEKHGSFSDNRMATTSPQTIDSQALKRIRGGGRGSVFTPADFMAMGGRAAVDQTLSRLARRGVLRRITRGLYLYPRRHAALGELQPSVETIAKALAARHRARLQPSGAYAANLLGLSEQVPTKLVFLTDGPSRIVKVGPTTIELRRTTPRNMAAAGQLSGLIIQAFRYLGKEHITPARINHLKRTIPARKRRALMKDLTAAPAWMHPILRDLAKS